MMCGSTADVIYVDQQLTSQPSGCKRIMGGGGGGGGVEDKNNVEKKKRNPF